MEPAVHSIPTNQVGIEEPLLSQPGKAANRPIGTVASVGSVASVGPVVPVGSVGPVVPARPSFHGSGAVAFSTKGEYGVRLMVQLGRHYGRGPASLTEIAAAEDMPRAYLEQLAFVLRDAGLLSSTRGAHGGYELSRPPTAIPMSEVLRALEGPLAPMICASDTPSHESACDRTSSCTVNLLWIRVRDAVAGALDGVTLADLVPLRAPIATAELTQPTGLEGALTSS
jgi:Rrf2 family transcriptional regulator, cysteine metabolism repressor